MHDHGPAWAVPPELQGDAPYSREAYGYNYTDPSSNCRSHSTLQRRAGAPPRRDLLRRDRVPARLRIGRLLCLRPALFQRELPARGGRRASPTTASVATPSNGKVSKYFCVRTSVNGRYIRQLCDPGANGDGTGA